MLYKALVNLQLSPTLTISVGSIVDTATLSEKDKASVAEEVRLGRGYLQKMNTPDTDTSRKAVAATEAAAKELMDEADEAVREAAKVKEAAKLEIEAAKAEAAKTLEAIKEETAKAVEAAQEAAKQGIMAAEEELAAAQAAARKAVKKAEALKTETAPASVRRDLGI